MIMSIDFTKKAKIFFTVIISYQSTVYIFYLLNAIKNLSRNGKNHSKNIANSAKI